jgi:hypothetical protein
VFYKLILQKYYFRIINSYRKLLNINKSKKMLENSLIESLFVEGFDDNKINLMDKGKAILLIVYNNQCVGPNRRAIPLAYYLRQ